MEFLRGVNPLSKLDHFGTFSVKIEIFKKILPGRRLDPKKQILARARQSQPLEYDIIEKPPCTLASRLYSCKNVKHFCCLPSEVAINGCSWTCKVGFHIQLENFVYLRYTIRLKWMPFPLQNHQHQLSNHHRTSTKTILWTKFHRFNTNALPNYTFQTLNKICRTTQSIKTLFTGKITAFFPGFVHKPRRAGFMNKTRICSETKFLSKFCWKKCRYFPCK